MFSFITRGALIGAGLCGLLAAAGSAQVGQVGFSIDWHAPMLSVPDSFSGVPITPCDVLTPVTFSPVPGPLPPPGLWMSGGLGPPAPGLGIPTHAACIGAPPCTLCPDEMDALSYGFDRLLQPMEPAGVIWFSTDEYGWGGMPATCIPPDLTSEGTFAGPADHAGDVWIDLGLPPGPIPPPPLGPFVGHTGAIDGDGIPAVTPFSYPGLGLIEPTPPTWIPCDIGDNLDALVVWPPGPLPMWPVYFSLDSNFPDPLGYPNEGTAIANNVSGGDVLVTPLPGAPPAIFAPAPLLGLDFFGFDTDDLDALILAENGTGAFEPSVQPYDWLSGQTDMLLFSVRRGSAVIGAPDSIFGMPIEEGDILTTPTPGGPPFPGIFFPAESLGLTTVRFGIPSPLTGFGDDLDALSSPFAPFLDCNTNGQEDALDVAWGFSTDVNQNGVPDECEIVGGLYCYGVGCPCGNDDPSAGCVNLTGVGAGLVATGTTSVANDDLVLTTTGLPVNQFGIFYMGQMTTNVPFGNGLRCVAPGPAGFHRFPIQNSGPAGVMTLGPGIVVFTCTSLPPSGCITVGSTWNFQTWYRDPTGPCGWTFNFSNALNATFTP